jgi:hypothetical protein
MVQGNGAYVILHATAGMNMRRMKSRIAIALALWLAVGGPSSVEGGHAASASSAANSAAVPVPTVVAQLSPRGGVRAPAGSVSAADFGAIGDGATDDTASLQRALNTGRAVFLLPGKSYAVTSPLKVPANGGIASDGTGEIFARASGFTNTDPTAAGRYRPTSTVIDASGMTTIPYTPNRNVTFRAFKLRFESTEGRSVDGIMARNVDGLVIDGVEISGFPAGVGIRLSSIVGESSVTHNRIRDFSSNTDFSKTYPGGRAQITGIEVDNDRINGVYSKGIVISDNQIMNLTVGPIFLAAHGFETDGINIHGGSGHRVERNQRCYGLISLRYQSDTRRERQLHHRKHHYTVRSRGRHRRRKRFSSIHGEEHDLEQYHYRYRPSRSVCCEHHIVHSGVGQRWHGAQ